MYRTLEVHSSATHVRVHVLYMCYHVYTIVVMETILYSLLQCTFLDRALALSVFLTSVSLPYPATRNRQLIFVNSSNNILPLLLQVLSGCQQNGYHEPTLVTFYNRTDSSPTEPLVQYLYR